MKVGLYFGSFNPVHIGHLAIANYIIEYSDLDELWFVVSPQNPLKEKKSLLSDYIRLELMSLAINDDQRFRASNIEFGLPKPSYTINTLSYLREKHPEKEFYLIMGADNYINIHKWKNHSEILNNYQILVYPRPGYPINVENTHHSITIINAPQMEISSSFIRNSIKNEKDVRFFLPEKVYQYINKNNIYK